MPSVDGACFLHRVQELDETGKREDLTFLVGESYSFVDGSRDGRFSLCRADSGACAKQGSSIYKGGRDALVLPLCDLAEQNAIRNTIFRVSSSTGSRDLKGLELPPVLDLDVALVRERDESIRVSARVGQPFARAVVWLMDATTEARPIVWTSEQSVPADRRVDEGGLQVRIPNAVLSRFPSALVGVQILSIFSSEAADGYRILTEGRRLTALPVRREVDHD